MGDSCPGENIIGGGGGGMKGVGGVAKLGVGNGLYRYVKSWPRGSVDGTGGGAGGDRMTGGGGTAMKDNGLGVFRESSTAELGTL